jgi:hypothetical protein
LILGSYGLAVTACAGWAGVSKGWQVALRLPAVFATLHVSYGLGFLRGVYDFMLRATGRRSVNDLGLSR